MDFTKFEQAEFTERTEDVPVPQLKVFFEKKEPPIWKIRCISGSEMFYAREAALKSQKSMEDLLGEFASGNLSDETIELVKTQIGLSIDTDKAPIHRDVVLRRNLLIYGSVPRCPENIAVKLSNEYGEVFQLITNKILGLYSTGNNPGELNGSGETKK